LLFFFPLPSRGQVKTEWYLSNAGGMAIERAASRFAAMRSPYCLLVEEGGALDIPELLRPYYRRPWVVELRVLYKEGEELRRQWLFRDGALNRLTAVFTRTGEAEEGGEGGNTGEDEDAGEDEGADEKGGGGPLGFIEFYGEHGLIVTERQFLEDGELIIDYTYRNAGGREVLIRADTRRRSSEEADAGEAALVCSDYYRYTRNYSLRLIERVFSKPPEGDGGLSAALLRFPRRSLDSEKETGFISPVPVYGSRFLEDLQAETLQRIVYTTDERGRILTERREDGEGNLVGELRNTWSGDRLSRIAWIAEGEERVTEYDYNGEGDRIEERNYRNGVLERLVRVQGDREEEELYMNGEPVLRTFWEGGRKVREEPVRPGERPRRRRNP
jgi:YD repeat-containing protein